MFSSFFNSNFNSIFRFVSKTFTITTSHLLPVSILLLLRFSSNLNSTENFWCSLSTALSMSSNFSCRFYFSFFLTKNRKKQRRKKGLLGQKQRKEGRNFDVSSGGLQKTSQQRQNQYQSPLYSMKRDPQRPEAA